MDKPIGGRYRQKVKEDGVFSWPCEVDEERVIPVYDNDELCRTAPGVFTMMSGVVKVGILIPEENIEELGEVAFLYQKALEKKIL